jgi:hypothetical protein
VAIVVHFAFVMQGLSGYRSILLAVSMAAEIL